MSTHEGPVELVHDGRVLVECPARVWSTEEEGDPEGWRGILVLATADAEDLPEQVTVRLAKGFEGEARVASREPGGEGVLAVTSTVELVGRGPAPFAEGEPPLPETPPGYSPEPFDDD